jgi:hypothetical protein
MLHCNIYVAMHNKFNLWLIDRGPYPLTVIPGRYLWPFPPLPGRGIALVAC